MFDSKVFELSILVSNNERYTYDQKRSGLVFAANVYDPIVDESIVRHDMNYNGSIVDSINGTASD